MYTNPQKILKITLLRNSKKHQKHFFYSNVFDIIDFLNYFVVKKYFFYFQYVNVIRYFVQKIFIYRM